MKLIVMVMPDAATRLALYQALERADLIARLGRDLFDVECWHQSFSVPVLHADSATVRCWRSALGLIQAAPFTLTLDHVVDRFQSHHWAFRPSKTPRAFHALVAAVQQTITAIEHEETQTTRPSAHVSISYRAPEVLPMTPIAPVSWTVQEFLLVEGGGKPYRYRALDRWPLNGAPDGGQLDLLAGLGRVG